MPTPAPTGSREAEDRPPLDRPGVLARLIARGASGSLALRVVSVVLMLGVQVALARLMGVESYGVYVYAISWMNLLVLVAKVGWDNTLLRFVADYRSRGRWGLIRGLLGTSHRVTLAASAVMVAGVLGWIALRGDRLSDELAWSLAVCGAAIPFLALSGLRRSTLRSLRYIVLSQVPESVVRPLVLLALLGVCWLTWSAKLWAPVAALFTLVAAIVSFAIGDRWQRRRMPPEVGATAPERASRLWTDTAVFLFFISLINMLTQRVDVLIIGAVLGARDVGLYAPASRMAEMIVFGLNATNMVAAPLIAEYHARGEPRQLQRIVTLSGYGILAYTLPVCAALVFAGRPILALFGEGFPAAYPVLVVLVAGHLVNALTGPVSFVMSMTGAQRQLSYITGVFLVLNAVCTYLLLPRFGVVGAAIATSAAMAGSNIVSTLYVYFRYGVNCLAIQRLPRADDDAG